MGASQKGNDENGLIIEAKSTPDDDLSLPKDYLVKFINCECGALIDASEPECWSCGKKFKQDTDNELNTSHASNTSNLTHTSDDSNTLEHSKKSFVSKEDSNLESQVTYTKFISCPGCGSNNEIYSAETKCWFCNKIMDTRVSWEQIVGSSKIDFTPITESNKKGDIKGKTNDVAKPRKKKAIIKYVLHCSKCNSWFITNDYSQKMECNSCGNKKTLSISYTCGSCKRFFDLNKITKQDCPYCKKPLAFTKEEALY